MWNTPLTSRTFDDIVHMKETVSLYDALPNAKVWGNFDCAAQYRAKHFHGIQGKFDSILVHNLDIEVHSGLYSSKHPVLVRNRETEEEFTCLICELYQYDREDHLVYDTELERWLPAANSCFVKTGGFPTPDKASWPITAIALHDNLSDEYHFFTTCAYEHNPDSEYVGHMNVKPYIYQSEEDLLLGFVNFVHRNHPDIITGWNVKLFDMPYIANRIYNVTKDEKFVARLSPWGRYNIREVAGKFGNRMDQVVTFKGIDILDGLELYRKHTFTPRESYKLDFIGAVEVGARKIDYSEYGNLSKLLTFNPQLYCEYCLVDVEVVHKILQELGLLYLTYTLAYLTNSNFVDTLGTVKMWDNFYHDILMNKKGIVVHNPTEEREARKFEGAYVKEINPSYHKWVVSEDYNSMYPHIKQMWNIGTETIVEDCDLPPELLKLRSKITVSSLLNREVDFGTLLTDHNLTVTPNGQFYRRDSMSIISEILRDLYAMRKKTKKEMKGEEQNLVNEKADQYREEVVRQLNARISQLDNLQMGFKICLNGEYGVGGTPYFRYFDVRSAEAVTTCGQLGIKTAEASANDTLNKMLKTSGVDYVIYIDTDSIYINYADIVKKKFGDSAEDNHDINEIVDFVDNVTKKILEPKLAKDLDEMAQYVNAFEQRLFMEREVIASSAIWTGKKHYIMHVWDNEGVRYKGKPKLKVMGMESVKSSTAEQVRKRLTEIYDIVLESDNRQPVLDYVQEFKDEFLALEPERMAIPRGVNEIDKYDLEDATGADVPMDKIKKGCPIHVRAAINYNRAIRKNDLLDKYPLITEGEKLKYVYLSQPNPFHTHVIGYESDFPYELGIEKYIDKHLMFEKGFVKPAMSVIEARNWTLKTHYMMDF